MIEIHNEVVKGIPLLHVVKNGNTNDKLPLIIFIHGFTSAKEHNLHFAYLLAEKGFRVILPDVIFHGERHTGESKNIIQFKFWNIVTHSILELDTLKDAFVEKGLVEEESIGLIGTSMGGVITFGALTQYKWINTAVSLMGSPAYEEFARMQIDHFRKAKIDLPLTQEQIDSIYSSLRKYDITAQPEALAGRPILFWHGKKDPTVPFQPTFNFYEQVKSDYAESPSNIEFIVDEQAAHKVTREALLRTIDWFEKHLLHKVNS